MTFGASKVILARLCLRSLIKATEKQKARVWPTLHTVLTLPGLKKATAASSPAHTAACLALPFTSLSGRRKVWLAQCRGACTCCQSRGPHHTQGGPIHPPIPHAPGPSLQAGHSGLCPEVRALVLLSHAAPAHPSIPTTLGTQEGR